MIFKIIISKVYVIEGHIRMPHYYLFPCCRILSLEPFYYPMILLNTHTEVILGLENSVQPIETAALL